MHAEEQHDGFVKESHKHVNSVDELFRDARLNGAREQLDEAASGNGDAHCELFYPLFSTRSQRSTSSNICN